MILFHRYSVGQLKSKMTDDNNIKDLIESATKTIFEKENEEKEIEDWEVDELLHWTNGLNFDG